MAPVSVSPLFLQFVDDEMLRAALLFDQLVEAVGDAVKRDMVKMSSTQKTAMAALLQSLQIQKLRMGEYFAHSLREQVSADTRKQAPQPKPQGDKKQSLALVEEDEVAVDVELSHTIEAIKSVAEYELRELQTYVSAIVGDLEMARDQNPFRPETWHGRCGIRLRPCRCRGVTRWPSCATLPRPWHSCCGPATRLPRRAWRAWALNPPLTAR